MYLSDTQQRTASHSAERKRKKKVSKIHNKFFLFKYQIAFAGITNQAILSCYKEKYKIL